MTASTTQRDFGQCFAPDQARPEHGSAGFRAGAVLRERHLDEAEILVYLRPLGGNDMIGTE
jgi:hypothetical protein